MQDFLIQFVVAGIIMGILDALWLKAVVPRFYRRELGQLVRDRPNFVAAIVFYLIYVIGVVAFVVGPALDRQSWQYALGYGALLGLVAYATYDLTNLATVKGFTVRVVIVDLVWGVALTSVVSVASYAIIRAT